jgi:hypothetical protein
MSVSPNKEEREADTSQAPDDQANARYARQMRKAFGRLPNAVARDPRFGPEDLVVIAYRCTITGNWVLDEIDLKKLVSKGLGKNVARCVIARLREFGLTKRWQLPGLHKGHFGEVREVFALPACAEDESRIVRRAWFDGSLTAKEFGALLYMRSGAGKGGAGTYCRELMDRFRWSRPTATKVIGTLLKRHLLERVVTRETDGTFFGVTYMVPQLWAEGLKRSPHAKVKSLSRTRRARSASAEYAAASTAAPAEPDGWQAARDELVAVDHAGVLRSKLLTPVGISPYLKMLDRHGDVARQAVKDRITSLVIGDGRRGQIRAWAYFTAAVRDAVHRQQMSEEGLRPGDVLGSWRDRPVQDVPF